MKPIVRLAGIASACAKKLRFFLLSSLVFAGCIGLFCLYSLEWQAENAAWASGVALVPAIVFLVFYWAFANLASLQHTLAAVPRQAQESKAELSSVKTPRSLFGIVASLWTLFWVKDSVEGSWLETIENLNWHYFCAGLILNPLSLTLLGLAWLAWLVLLLVVIVGGSMSLLWL